MSILWRSSWQRLSRTGAFGAMRTGIVLLLVVAAPAAAQWVDPQTCEQGTVACDAARKEKSDKDAASEQEQRQMAAARMRQARALLKTPPLPGDRNGLLGSWRLGEGQRSNIGLGVVTGRGELSEMIDAFKSLDKVGCDIDWGGGISFTPSTYSKGGSGIGTAGDVKGAPIAYRSGRRGDQQVTVAIADSYHMMAFEIMSPNSIVDGMGCVLVRVGAPAANAVADANASSNARTAAAGRVAPSSRPSPEVCRNAMFETLGSAHLAEVKPALLARFKSMSSGAVPGSDKLRIDARASACDDPRINATSYDFDAAGVLQAINIVWARPPGPAPSPLFNERAALLARLFGLPAPKSPSRLEGQSATAHIVLEDQPERSLVFEVYSAPR